MTQKIVREDLLMITKEIKINLGCELMVVFM